MPTNQIIEVPSNGASPKAQNYIDIISTETSNLSIALILILLFFGTLRSAIAYLGWTRGGPLEKYFYDQTHEKLASLAVSKTFEEIGITPDTRSSIKLLCSQVIRNTRLLDGTQNLKKLLVLLATNSHPCMSIYGKDTPVHTSVIINTMEASLVDESCTLMAELLIAIYTKKLSSYGNVDFVVVPKSGNPLLGKRLADMLKAMCLVCKSDSDSSRVMPENHSGNSNSNISLNIEGFTYLKQQALASSYPLTGILIDCNCSGGNGLIRTAAEFNRIISQSGANVKPLQNGMVLFRADLDLSPVDFDHKFQEAVTPLSITRYIDLDEHIKESLLGLSHVIKSGNGEIHKPNVQQKVAEISQYARENGLLIFE